MSLTAQELVPDIEIRAHELVGLLDGPFTNVHVHSLRGYQKFTPRYCALRSKDVCSDNCFLADWTLDHANRRLFWVAHNCSLEHKVEYDDLYKYLMFILHGIPVDVPRQPFYFASEDAAEHGAAGFTREIVTIYNAVVAQQNHAQAMVLHECFGHRLPAELIEIIADMSKKEIVPL